MAINCSTKDLENKKFRECPTDSVEVVVATKICQDDDETIKVEFATSGSPLNEYDEANSVAGLATETILDYTVPALKKVTLGTVSASGENRAVYKVEINSTTKAKKRSYFTEYNVEFPEFKTKLVAGDNVKIIVENKTNSIADFNASFTGTIDDA